ncbi:MAG: PAS domain-containing protein [Cyclobacteriaceae bacterium]
MSHNFELSFTAKIIIAAISGGLITGIVSLVTQSRDISYNQIQMLIVELKESNQQLRKENLQIEDLRHQIFFLRQKIMLLESGTQDLPFPMWLKDTDGTMLALNPAYESVFLHPNGFTKEQYLGFNDTMIWPHEIANEFRANDLWVMNNKKVFRGMEKIPDPLTKELINWHVVKYPRYASGVIIGIGGVAIRDYKPP